MKGCLYQVFSMMIFCATLSALTWQELENENASRVGQIHDLFELALEETHTSDACIVILGSHSYGISMPDSDIDFALLIPHVKSEMLFLPLLERFYWLCRESHLFWDIHGWHPPVSQMSSGSDSEKLIASPLQLSKIRAQDDKITLRYALYNPKYGGGDAELYQLFKDANSIFPFSSNAVVAEEKAKTKRAIEYTRRHAKVLKGALQNEFVQPIKNIHIEIKTRWIKPMIELLQYLCISHGFLPKNAEESIDLLLKHNILPPQLALSISDFLLFTIELRNRLGKKFLSESLTKVEIETLVKGYDTLYKLSQI